MKEKVSIAPCTGMSDFGLICRAVTSDLSESNENIISICIPSTAADEKAPRVLKKYPIIALNACSRNCVNEILKNKGINVVKSIDAMEYAEKNDLKPGEVARLGENGEKTVEELKKYVLKEIKDIR